MVSGWVRRYRLCLLFASFFNSEHRYDIVHDAWIYYTDKTGEDLFVIDLKKESSFLYTIVKKAFYRWYYHERRGEKYRYEGIENISGGFDDSHEILIAKEVYENFYNRLLAITEENEHIHYRNKSGRELPLEIFKLAANGYDNVGIAKQLGISKQLVGQYIKKIRDMGLNNPFHGDKTIIKKSIAQNTWEEKETNEKDKYDLHDCNEYYELYVEKESGDGLLVKLKQEKINRYLQSQK